jgi:hypothetical protein
MDCAVIAPGDHCPTRVATVSDAVARHRRVRAFLDRPVDEEQVVDILRRAAPRTLRRTERDDPLQSYEIR